MITNSSSPTRRNLLAASAAAGAVALLPVPLAATGGGAQLSSDGDVQVIFDTLTVRKEGAVLFAEISAPPMNLLGPELVRDLVSLIQGPETDHAVKVLVFKSADPDYFISHVDIGVHLPTSAIVTSRSVLPPQVDIVSLATHVG